MKRAEYIEALKTERLVAEQKNSPRLPAIDAELARFNEKPGRRAGRQTAASSAPAAGATGAGTTDNDS
jgi:hypothetical protein